MHHPTDRLAHTTAFVTPVMEHWLQREIAQWVYPMKDRSDDPSHHERTLLPLSYISLPLFSDESRFSLQRGDGRVCVYHRRNERYADCCVLERDRFGGVELVMGWVAIAHGYRSPLIVIDGNLNAEQFRDYNLAHHVIPLFHNANISIY